MKVPSADGDFGNEARALRSEPEQTLVFRRRADACVRGLLHQIQGWIRGALRNGIILARQLNRTLVLPHFECFCER